MNDLTRRQIRYICFRLQTEASGGNKAKKEKTGIMQYVDDIKEHMESQDEFGGWLKFAKTWDVDDKSPLVTVKRTFSIQTEWNNTLKDEAKELPLAEAPKGKKLLQNKLAKKIQEKKAGLAHEPSLPSRDAGGRFASTKKSFWDKLS